MMKDLIDVREVLGVASGNRISFIVEGSTVRIVNSAVYRSGSRAVRKRHFRNRGRAAPMLRSGFFDKRLSTCNRMAESSYYRQWI